MPAGAAQVAVSVRKRVVACACIIAGCVPVTSTVHDEDVVVRTFESNAGGRADVVRVAANPTSADLVLTAESVKQCTREQHQEIRHDHDIIRRSDHFTLAMTYVLGVVVAGAGAAVIADANHRVWIDAGARAR